MSVQLIVYPQNYEGQYSVYSTPFYTEYVSDYSFNIGALGTGFSGSAGNIGSAISNLIPLNIWQQYNITGGSFTSANPATVSSGKITLDSASSASLTGAYQLISNLTIGSSYVLEVERLAGTTGIVIIGHSGNWTVNGTQYKPILFSVLPNTVGTHTFTFTATDTEQVFLINYYNEDNTNLEIGSVSIKESVASAPTVDAFSDGQVILDLYEESNIPLSLSVDNFKNVAEKSQSYSKAFKLPSTKRNNKIFSSLYDVTRSVKSDIYAFNPYKKTKAILKEDGYTIFDGYLRLIDITEKEEEVSYSVNLYGDTITLADTLKDKKFKDIDFTELGHDYDKANIKLSHYDNNGVVLTTALPTSSFAYKSALGTGKTDVIKYPFVKWNGSSYLNAGNVVLQKLEDAFRPFINCKYLVDRIITEAGFTYNSDFLESTDFTKLFMDFNWGSDNTPNSTTTTMFNAKGYLENFATTSYTSLEVEFWNNGINAVLAPSVWSVVNNKFTASVNNQNFNISYNYDLENSSASSAHTLTARWVHKDSSGNVLEEIDLTNQSIAIGGNYSFQGSFTRLLQSGETLAPEFLADTTSKIRQKAGTTPSQYSAGTETSEITLLLSVEAITNNSILLSLRGDLGQWEYLKGLLNMFNLLVLQDKDNPANLIIEPYKAVFIDDTLSQYITHTTHDWTNKVDVTEMKLTPLKLKKRVLLDFVEDSNDYATEIYKNATGYKYGSQEVDASTFNLLEGETKVSAKPFGSTFIKPIFDGFTTEMTIPVIYAGKEDGTFEGFNNKPRILYNNGRVTMSSNTYYIPAQNGLSSENQSSFGQMSHLSEIPTTATTKDYNFKTGQLIGSIGNTPVDNLYNEYWAPYYDELYNPDTKEVKLKVYLSPSEISNFNFYDKCRIKNALYRVNKIDYKPYEMSTVELILI
tara:strand:+ start:4091 stop:6850 length:2760 start_codon:yes stop_codon:yes gene_type:complete